MGISRALNRFKRLSSYHRHHLTPVFIILGKSKWFPKSRIAKLQCMYVCVYIHTHYSRQSHTHLLSHLPVNPGDLSHTSLTLSTPGWPMQNSSLSWIRCSIFITSLLRSSHPAAKKNLSCKMSLVTFFCLKKPFTHASNMFDKILNLQQNERSQKQAWWVTPIFLALERLR